MRIHQVLTTPISTKDKGLIIERMDQERHLAASALGCAEMNIAAIMAELYTLSDKRVADPELDKVLGHIEGACRDGLAALNYDEIELDGALDFDNTKSFLELVREKADLVKRRFSNMP